MEKLSNTNSVKVSIADCEDLMRNVSIANEPAGVSSWLINETNVETLFGVTFTSLSDIDDFSMSIKEGKYADILSTMSFTDIDADVNVTETIGKKHQDEVNKASGTQLSSSPKVSTSSPLVSPSTIINVPRELNSIDVAATFGVPLTTVGDLHKLINDIEAGKHEKLLSGMTNDDLMETLDALGSICNSIQANCNNASSKDSLVIYGAIGGINTIVYILSGCKRVCKHYGQPQVNSEADLVDSITIGIPSLTGDGFTKETIHVEYEWRPPRCDECKIFGHVYDHCLKKIVSPPIATTSNVVAPTVEKSNDDFQTMGKKNKRKGKSKTTNGGQFTGPSVKQTVKYEPKATTSAPKKGATNVRNPSKSSSMLKTADTSPKNDHFTTYNSFSALNDEEEEEEVENVYDESANLVPNINTSGSLSFTTAAG
ncbi:hypothetical protein Tco_0152609 [Tanacetum coccineum]